MSISYNKREKAIQKLFDYEEENNVPENFRLTLDAYADCPTIDQVSPRKKAYVDIRDVISRAKDYGVWN